MYNITYRDIVDISNQSDCQNKKNKRALEAYRLLGSNEKYNS